ncbi:MAG TPA: hypothetical protein VN783_09290 [Thermoanaerobaculia bacterium]|nr:hypothetical protein [Thermoanaerobaculia bacterium]
MAWKKLLAKIFLYGMLEIAALSGAPVRPDEIEALSRLMTATQVAEVLRQTDGDGDPPEP